MIPFPIQSKPVDAPQGESLGVQRAAAKKKSVKSFAALFSSLMEKAREATPEARGASSLRRVQEGAGGKAARSTARSDDSITASDASKRNPAEKKKAAMGGSLGSGAGGGAASVPADPAPAALPGQVSAQLAAVKASGTKETKTQEPSEGAPSKISPHRGNEAKKRAPVPDNAEGAAAAAVAAAANAPAKNLPKAEASSKGEEKVEGVDSRKKDKRKDRLEIEVFDQRSGSAYGASAGNSKAVSAPEAGEGTSKGGGDLVLTLREGPAEGGADKTGSSGDASSQKTSFADALARELRESYNNDIVQRASVVLKDGGDGLVRLSLKPEALGSVKIKLELADNKIAGKILVETDEALKAFGKELRSLEQAFLDGGFDGASLELALSSGDSGAGSGRREDSGAPRPFFSDRLAAGEYDSAVPEAGTRRPIGVREDALIDVLA